MLDDGGARVPRVNGDQGDAVIAIPDSHIRTHVQDIGELCELRQGRRLQVAGNAPREDSQPGPRLDLARVIAHQQGMVFQGPQDPVGHGTVDPHGVCKFRNGQRRLRRSQDFQCPYSARQGLGRRSLRCSGGDCGGGHGFHPRRLRGPRPCAMKVLPSLGLCADFEMLGADSRKSSSTMELIRVQNQEI